MTRVRRKREKRNNLPSATRPACDVVARPLLSERTLPHGSVSAKPYLYAEELSALTPWTVDAINTKVRRGELQRGVHYFQDHKGGRLIFKWAAIVDLIERVSANGANEGASLALSHAPNGKVLNVAKAKAELQRLLD
jgi:hypothetical protein